MQSLMAPAEFQDRLFQQHPDEAAIGETGFMPAGRHQTAIQ